MLNIIFEKDNIPVLGYDPDNKVFHVLNYDLIPHEVYEHLWIASSHETKAYVRENNNRRVVARWLSTISGVTRLDCDTFLEQASAGDTLNLLALRLKDGWEIHMVNEELPGTIKY